MMGVNIALRRFMHNHDNIATEGSPKPGLCPAFISNDFMGSINAQYHMQYCTPHTFYQFGELFMHSYYCLYILTLYTTIHYFFWLLYKMIITTDRNYKTICDKFSFPDIFMRVAAQLHYK